MPLQSRQVPLKPSGYHVCYQAFSQREGAACFHRKNESDEGFSPEWLERPKGTRTVRRPFRGNNKAARIH